MKFLIVIMVFTLIVTNLFAETTTGTTATQNVSNSANAQMKAFVDTPNECKTKKTAKLRKECRANKLGETRKFSFDKKDCKIVVDQERKQDGKVVDQQRYNLTDPAKTAKQE